MMASTPLVNPLDPVPQELRRIEGIEKLRRQIQKEIQSPNVNEKSSNLPHLLSILKCIQVTPPSSSSSSGGGGGGGGGRGGQLQLASAVQKPFTYSNGRSGRLIVDIVSPDGDCWYKVSARNPKALSLLVAGGGGFGQKSIVDQVSDYLECAKENPCIFKTPKVTVIFTSGIGTSVAEELEEMGAFVQGERIPDSLLGIHPRIKIYDGNLQSFRDNIEEIEGIDEETVCGFKNPSLDDVTKLNLDITAFLAYVSNLTNGHCNVAFKKSILADQAEAERVRPQKAVLDRIFQGRELFCCETALREFNSILSTVGGPKERERTVEFLKRITIVPDNISERVKALDVAGNIKSRSRVIFGTGDSLEAITVTANSGFVRSAKTQGFDLPSFVHESRALTEQKENIVIAESES